MSLEPYQILNHLNLNRENIYFLYSILFKKAVHHYFIVSALILFCSEKYCF